MYSMQTGMVLHPQDPKPSWTQETILTVGNCMPTLGLAYMIPFSIYSNATETIKGSKRLPLKLNSACLGMGKDGKDPVEETRERRASSGVLECPLPSLSSTQPLSA